MMMMMQWKWRRFRRFCADALIVISDYISGIVYIELGMFTLNFDVDYLVIRNGYKLKYFSSILILCSYLS